MLLADCLPQTVPIINYLSRSTLIYYFFLAFLLLGLDEAVTASTLAVLGPCWKVPLVAAVLTLEEPCVAVMYPFFFPLILSSLCTHRSESGIGPGLVLSKFLGQRIFLSFFLFFLMTRETSALGPPMPGEHQTTHSTGRSGEGVFILHEVDLERSELLVLGDQVDLRQVFVVDLRRVAHGQEVLALSGSFLVGGVDLEYPLVDLFGGQEVFLRSEVLGDVVESVDVIEVHDQVFHRGRHLGEERRVLEDVLDHSVEELAVDVLLEEVRFVELGEDGVLGESEATFMNSTNFST